MKIKKLLKLIFPDDEMSFDDAIAATALLRDCLKALEADDPEVIGYRNRILQVRPVLTKFTAEPKPRQAKIRSSTKPGPSLLANGDSGSPLT